MYHYEHCKVTRVIDGDTFSVEFDLGFSIKVHWRCRLKGFDTAETHRPSCPGERLFGEHATKLVKELILDQPVRVTTHKLGIYGRYTADIFHRDPKNPDGPFVSLKDTLTQEKHHKRDLDCRLCPFMAKCKIVDEVYAKLKLRWHGTPDPNVVG